MTFACSHPPFRRYGEVRGCLEESAKLHRFIRKMVDREPVRRPANKRWAQPHREVATGGEADTTAVTRNGPSGLAWLTRPVGNVLTIYQPWRVLT